MGIFEKALISGEEILTFIPQRFPIVMVDSYYGKNGNISYTGYTPAENTLFCRNGVFTESGIIEHMAQSAALSVGVDFKSRGEVIPVGFIGALSKLKIERLPETGHMLETTVSEIQKYQDISLVSVRVESFGKVVAEGELKIFLQREEK
ncbi:MAG TPA: hydroxymyristoyl-ACP dehydratase [Bacteroidales bacterium]|nr:hydroxymyristoyl-ACP dehydratase [Bacteroidales bacterium]